MSDPTLPDAGQQEQPSAPAAPAEPPWPQTPLPVVSLPYSYPVRSGRPGILTAVGVISIVVASFSILGSLYDGIQLLSINMMARFAPMMAPPPPAPPANVANPFPATNPTASSAKSLVVTQRGLESSARAVVTNALGEMRFLTGPRIEQLDGLLAEAGQDMFDTNKTPLTGEDITSQVLANATGLSADPSVAGPDTFRTEKGRFELYDDHAVFYPLRGNTVRVSTLTTSTAGLTSAQVEQIISQAQATSGNAMNPSQLAALRTLLSTPGQQYVSVITIPTAIRSAQPMGDGSVFITFPNGYAQIGAQGQVTMSGTTSGAGTSTVTATGAFPFIPGSGGKVRINGAAAALVGFSAIAGAGLAIYLLVIGIMVLRDSHRGRKFHLIFAWLKIPLTFLAALSMWWLTSDFYEQFLTQSGAPGVAVGPTMSITTAIWQGVVGVLALIYPISLLIVMQTKTVKDYYNTVRMD